MFLRRKFWLGFGLIGLLTAGLAGFGLRALSATEALVLRLYDQSVIGSDYANAANLTLRDAHELLQHSLLVGPDTSTSVISSFLQSKGKIQDDLRLVRQRAGNAAIVEALDKAEAAIEAWFASGMTVLAPNPGGVTALPMPAVVQRQSMAALAAIDDLADLVIANGYVDRTRAEEALGTSNAVLTGLAAAIIAIGTVFAWMVTRLVLRPIGSATRIAEEIAAGGTAEIPVSARRDEIGRLINGLVSLQARLAARATQVAQLLKENEQSVEALRQTNLQFDTALNNMAHGLVLFDPDLRIKVLNRQFCTIFGIDSNQVTPGCSYADLLALSFDAGNYPGRAMEDVLAERRQEISATRPLTVVRTIADGRSIECVYEPMPDGCLVGTFKDITEQRRTQDQIVFLARHDALTQLPNRVLFQERLQQALAQAERGAGFALLCLDLDKFKAVNDTLGHSAGDAVLRAVAGRLQDAVREVDSVARLGGDEFAILQAGVTGMADATVLARRVVELISNPYEFEGKTIDIGTSIGIALVPGGTSAHPAQVLKNADLALYRAKQNGRGTWRFFEAAMDMIAKARREIEHDLRAALELQEFELRYQPLMCGRTLRVTGFEALLRWFHPMRGEVPPATFIPVLEELGLIVQIGDWALRQACTDIATWPAHLRVAVNLSPVQFRGEALVESVAKAMASAGIAPGRLELEITESVPLQEDQATLSVLHALGGLGVRITLDDFGTGYSSLSYLRAFPFHTIKIDRSFVKELPEQEESVAIIGAIASLAGKLHMGTTAEGVETREQLDFLVAAGCTELQGYLFSKPVAAHEVPALIERLREWAAYSDRDTELAC